MKRTMLIAILAVTAFSTMPAIADSTTPTGKGVQTKQNAPCVSGFDKQAAQIQDNLKLMQEQMDKIDQTQDPQERQKLLQEHWAMMQKGMDMMQGMMGGNMMGGNMMGGNMMGGNMMGGNMMGWKGMSRYYSKLTPEQMKHRQYMMEQYMGMQQQMMNQMMQQQHHMWMQPPQ